MSYVLYIYVYMCVYKSTRTERFRAQELRNSASDALPRFIETRDFGQLPTNTNDGNSREPVAWKLVALLHKGSMQEYKKPMGPAYPNMRCI